jgi:hypothetical protein
VPPSGCSFEGPVRSEQGERLQGRRGGRSTHDIGLVRLPDVTVQRGEPSGLLRSGPGGSRPRRGLASGPDFQATGYHRQFRRASSGYPQGTRHWLRGFAARRGRHLARGLASGPRNPAYGLPPTVLVREEQLSHKPPGTSFDRRLLLRSATVLRLGLRPPESSLPFATDSPGSPRAVIHKPPGISFDRRLRARRPPWFGLGLRPPISSLPAATDDSPCARAGCPPPTELSTGFSSWAGIVGGSR